MNIDNLISKYLDGELTENEDLQLRNLISSNDNARDIFNTYIDLHIAAKEDAKSINTPAELKSETEDLVMMAIMSASAMPAPPAKSLNIFNLFPRQLVSMVAALLLITFTYTSDMNIFKYITPIYSKAEMAMEIPVVSSREVNVSTADNSVSNSVSQSLADNTKDEVIVDSDEINTDLEAISLTNVEQISKVTQNNTLFVKENNENTKVIASDNIEQLTVKNLNPTFTILDENTTSSNMQFGDIGNKLGQQQNNITINNIQLTAFTSSPYTLYGFDDKANASINSYSQAVSVNLNDKTSVGLEIGYSDIAYRAETFTQTNVLDKYGRETGQQIVFRTERDKDYAMYWGQMFVQSELYKIDNFDLGLRLGLGISGSGLTSNSKLLASYELVSGIKITAGTEFNYFTVALPQLVNSYTQNYYSFSMVYGLQFNF
ncbi:MAG: hypothetical protein CVV25_03805 [Ignavibacteriae bacterium HGW-Ignavibacteriae-4]|nr:MAG: hypothetical protein CVV25_03805 [Ignavibacteriae bacterium HGW-Ignavibacteriae-4]